MMPETPMKLCKTAQFFGKTYSCKNWGNGPKIGFFEFKEKFVIKKLFWFDMVKNEYGQSGLWTLELSVSQE